jgi:hypothetical protein
MSGDASNFSSIEDRQSELASLALSTIGYTSAIVGEQNVAN